MEQEILDAYVKAGKIAGQALDYGCTLIVEGASMLEVLEQIEAKILALGGDFAFPPQISLNDVAAHYCAGPDEETVFKKGDVAKLDLGVHIDGYVADTARTVVIPTGDAEEDKKLELLKEASKAALEAALKLAKPGTPLVEIGKAIEKEIKSRGFNPVVNLSGHGLGKFVIHDSPSVPNFEAPTNEVLHEDQAIAIEPFASTGAGMIYESANATIYAVQETRPVRSPMTREVLKTIVGYNGLPFTKRWLVAKHGPGKTAMALRELKNLGVLHEYPPLPDKAHGLVSQHEHTVIVKDEPIVTTRSSKNR
ncbi:type II methionyl aminopeptidase [Candidatus Woesearchaeota archaeon]|nr:type II methionyl aminopeptidase [Candidatus Woesearchaeota archaeon]